jgi:hypothetical protein
MGPQKPAPRLSRAFLAPFSPLPLSALEAALWAEPALAALGDLWLPTHPNNLTNLSFTRFTHMRFLPAGPDVPCENESVQLFAMCSPRLLTGTSQIILHCLNCLAMRRGAIEFA